MAHVSSHLPDIPQHVNKKALLILKRLQEQLERNFLFHKNIDPLASKNSLAIN